MAFSRFSRNSHGASLGDYSSLISPNRPTPRSVPESDQPQGSTLPYDDPTQRNQSGSLPPPTPPEKDTITYNHAEFGSPTHPIPPHSFSESFPPIPQYPRHSRSRGGGGSGEYSQFSSPGLTDNFGDRAWRGRGDGGLGSPGMGAVPLGSPYGYSGAQRTRTPSPSDSLGDRDVNRLERIETPSARSLKLKKTFTKIPKLIKVSEWGVHPVLPATMVFLFLCGFAAAVGHHLFYASLHHKEVGDQYNQLMKVRYGNALAYLTKACLVGSVGVAYKQRIWFTMREKALTLRGIDVLWGALEDPSQFVLGGLDPWKNAKVSMIMALCSWLIPIAAVLSPATLTTMELTTISNQRCSVPSLHFENENLEDYRNGGTLGPAGYQLTFVNNTSNKLAFGDQVFDYYDQPSLQAKRIALTTIFSKDILLPRERPEACEKAKCTYDLNMTLPGYRCTEYSFPSEEIEIDFAEKLELSEDASDGTNLPKESLIQWKDLIPNGNNRYKALVTGNSSYPYVRPDPHQFPKSKDEPLAGTFTQSPELWIGYVLKTNTTLPDTSLFKKKWEDHYSKRILHCKHYSVVNAIQVTYHASTAAIPVTYRINSTSYELPLLSADPTEKTVFKSPLTPTGPGMDNSTGYMHYTSYFALSSFLLDYIRGEITQTSSDSNVVTTSEITTTALIDPLTTFAVPNFMPLLQELYRNISLSLLSEPRLVVTESTRTSTLCTVTRNHFVFSYARTNLWIGYSLVLFVALTAVCIGALSFVQNGVGYNTDFSTVLRTTRNHNLDQVVKGACLGGQPLDDSIETVRLRFGVLVGGRRRDSSVEMRDLAEGGVGRRVRTFGDEEAWKEGGQGVEHTAFGREEEVRGIRKGEGRFA